MPTSFHSQAQFLDALRLQCKHNKTAIKKAQKLLCKNLIAETGYCHSFKTDMSVEQVQAACQKCTSGNVRRGQCRTCFQILSNHQKNESRKRKVKEVLLAASYFICAIVRLNLRIQQGAGWKNTTSVPASRNCRAHCGQIFITFLHKNRRMQQRRQWRSTGLT